MYASFTITGAAEIEKRLKAMEPKIARKLLKKTLREGAKLIGSKIKTNAKSTVGGAMGNDIARNIIVRAGKNKKRYSYKYASLINPAAEQFIHITKEGNRFYIPTAIEYGHASPYKSGKGKTIPAIPFMRPAIEASKSEVEKIIVSGINQAIEGK